MRHETQLSKNPLKALSAAISIAIFSLHGNANAQSVDPEVEEVLVTGTFIRRTDGFTSASPVTQITADFISNQGTANMGEVVKNSVFNLGTGTNNGIQGTSDTSSSFNLRGLGESATLTLMDGIRVPTDNVNVMMPSIAIQRLDILKDGAAQLYGTDAVAGVVNYVPYTTYNGLEIEYHEERDSRDTYNERQLQLITGTDISDNATIVFAGSHRSQGDLRWDERPDHLRAGFSSSGNANPANFIVPLRDANGQLTGKTVSRPDPNCGATRGDPAVPGANPNGFLSGGQCWIDFGDGRSHRNATDFTSAYTAMTWDVSPDLAFKGQFNFSRILANPRGSVAGSGVNRNLFPSTIRGEQPGNTFRAKNSLGQPLFARDADGNGVPDRDASGRVIINPSGIPFNEDVGWGRMRLIGKSHPLSGTGVHNSDTSMREEYDRRYIRMALNSTFTAPFVENWDGSVTYAFMTSRDVSTEPRAFSAKGITAGLNCDVVKNRQACYNPFAPVPGDASTINSNAIMGSIASNYRQDNENELQTLDIVFNGPVPLGRFELPGGEIGAAIGLQRREDAFDDRPAASLISGDAATLSVVQPYGGSRTVNSSFIEVSLPVLDNMEVNVAARDERFSTGQAELVKKLGAVYEPLDWLALRATWGEAFIAPNLSQLLAPEECSSSTAVEDPFTSFSGFLFGCLSGNRDLRSETSDTLSFGFDIDLDNGITANLTWSETDFTDRLVVSNNQDVLNVDFFNFKLATGFTPTPTQKKPTAEQVLAWQKNPLSDPRVVRSPSDAGLFERITRGTTNASTLLVRSYDGEIDYSLELSNIGTVGVNLAASYIEDFLYQTLPTDPIRNAVGEQNDFTGTAPAIPRLKTNLTLSWSNGQHRASLIGRYVSAVNFDAAQNDIVGTWAYSNWRHVDVIRAWTQMDASYTYRDIGIPTVGGSLSVTLGARNVFDREAQKSGMSSGVISELQDALGRVFYGRLNYTF